MRAACSVQRAAPSRTTHRLQLCHFLCRQFWPTTPFTQATGWKCQNFRCNGTSSLNRGRTSRNVCGRGSRADKSREYSACSRAAIGLCCLLQHDRAGAVPTKFRTLIHGPTLKQMLMASIALDEVGYEAK